MALLPASTPDEHGDGPADDEGFGEDDELQLALESEEWKSITASVREHSYYGGRRYHSYRDGKYPIPNDTIEQEREYMKHELVLLVTQGKWFHAPIGEHPQKILDLGTGVGIWAIEVADMYPGAEVVAVDLSPIQPEMVPSNVNFLIDDVEEDWVDPISKNFDFIHARNFLPLTCDAPAILDRAFHHIKPGGWFEAQDFNASVACDDGTMPPDFPLLRFWACLQMAMGRMGCDLSIAERTGALMRRAGFVNVQGRAYRVPVGSWAGAAAGDEVKRYVGKQMRKTTGGFLEAASVRPLAELGMSEAQIHGLMQGVWDALNDESVHAYAMFYSWVGQKPAA